MCLCFAFFNAVSVLYYGGLFLRDGPDNVREGITLVMYEVTVLGGVQFCLYASERTAPYYFVGSL